MVGKWSSAGAGKWLTVYYLLFIMFIMALEVGIWLSVHKREHGNAA